MSTEAKGQYWINRDNVYTYGHVPQITEKLPAGVYELDFGGMPVPQFMLNRMGNNFGLPEKIYSLEQELIDRILKTYRGLDKNFGVVLKGLKGTGKTIVGKILCNTLDLPVILVTKPFPNLAGFVSSIQQDVILFFDEFEKIYDLYRYRNDDDEDTGQGKASISNLLMLMDGAFTCPYKRLFIMTTNKDTLPDAMLSRPTRIRYIREFQDLDVNAIREILNDTVKNKALIPALVEYLKTLEIITVDIVKALAEEANLYDTADPEFFKIFNVKKSDVRYSMYRIDPETNTRTFVATNLELSFDMTDDDRMFQEGYYLRIAGTHYGQITGFDPNTLTVRVSIQERDPDSKNHRDVIDVEKIYTFEKNTPCHYSFY